MNKSICNAIRNRNLIEFNYDGEIRIVEPHCYGETTAGNEGLRAFQVDGFSSKGKMGWKMYNMSKAEDLNVLDETFDSPRPGYREGDRGMNEIFCEI